MKLLFRLPLSYCGHSLLRRERRRVFPRKSYLLITS